MKKKFFSLRRQMVLVYLLGGALPMLLIIGILIGTQRSTMLEQAATAAVTELTMLKNTLNSQCGVGMTPAALDALRQSLAAEDFDRSHIGVANVHHRIRMFYGAAWGLTVDSAPGQGTTATLRLPRCETNEKTDKENAVL